MTDIFSNDPAQRARWKAQANQSAIHLKTTQLPDQLTIKVGFAFDDAIISVELERKTVLECDTDDLSRILYDAIVEAVDTTKEGPPPVAQRH